MSEPTRNEQASKPKNLDDALENIDKLKTETRTRLGRVRTALVEATKVKAALEVDLDFEERYLEELESLLVQLQKVKGAFYDG